LADSSAIGCDIGGTNTKIVLVRDDGQILRQATIPTTIHGDPGPFFDELRTIIAGFADGSVRGIGISTAGFVAPDRRSIIFNPNTPALVGVDYVDQLAPLGLPVVVEADLNASTLGEYAFGAGRGVRRLLVATIGTGLGAGVIADDRLVRFSAHMAGDTGHVILDPTGPRCSAGCRGCAEAFVSTPGLLRAYAQARDRHPDSAQLGTSSGEEITTRMVIAAARDARPIALVAVAEVGRWTGQWLASLAPIFLPERIVVGGGVAETGEALLGPCRARFEDLVGLEYCCPIVAGEIGVLAGAVGATVPFLIASVG
jgi:glucokinase